MACGDRYLHLLIVDGNPSDQPCGLATLAGAGCSVYHAQAWNKRADEVWYLVRESWNQLIRLENARGDWASSTALLAQVESFERASEQMMRWSWWGIAKGDVLTYNKEVVASAIDVVRAGACTLERLADAIEQLSPGSTIEPGSSPTAEPNGWGTSGLIILGLAAVAAMTFGGKEA